jgi:hypothetical protein
MFEYGKWGSTTPAAERRGPEGRICLRADTGDRRSSTR